VFLGNAGELVLGLLHVYLSSAEAYTFGFQSQALLNRRISAQFDFSTCA
jgi:hypothetical protein